MIRGLDALLWTSFLLNDSRGPSPACYTGNLGRSADINALVTKIDNLIHPDLEIVYFESLQTLW